MKNITNGTNRRNIVVMELIFIQEELVEEIVVGFDVTKLTSVLVIDENFSMSPLLASLLLGRQLPREFILTSGR